MVLYLYIHNLLHVKIQCVKTKLKMVYNLHSEIQCCDETKLTAAHFHQIIKIWTEQLSDHKITVLYIMKSVLSLP